MTTAGDHTVTLGNGSTGIGAGMFVRRSAVMAGGKPFKLNGDAAGNASAAGANGRPRFSIAETNKHAVDEGETLIEAGQENMQPDMEIDSTRPAEAGQPHGEGHPQRPAFPVANPWPAAKPVAHKPFKV